MLLHVFCIYDAKAETYMTPTLFRTKGEAMRAITELVNDPKHNFFKYSEDYSLFELGKYDDQTAKFQLLATPHAVGVLHEYKRISTANPAQS